MRVRHNPTTIFSENKLLYWCTSSTSALKSREGLKTGTALAGTLTGSPVRGFRPNRGRRSRTLKVPKPRISMFSPSTMACLMALRKPSTSAAQSFFVTPGPMASCTRTTKSAFVIFTSSKSDVPPGTGKPSIIRKRLVLHLHS